jgi:hypothetical protein
MKKILFVAIFASTALAGFNSCSTSGTVTVRPTAVVSVRSVAPSPRHVWVSGDYVWRNGNYVWVNGYWAEPRRGRYWTDGRWQQRRGGYRWVPGRWGR